MASLLRQQGVEAAFVSGGTRDVSRQKIIGDFKAGRTQVLCNCEVLTTGFDAPKVTHVVMARPTVSQVLYEQMVSRGLRGPTFGGTATCQVVDLEDNYRSERPEPGGGFRGITRAHDQQFLARELHGVAAIVRVQHAPREFVETFEGRDVRGGEVATRVDDEIEFSRRGGVGDEVVRGDRELAGGGRILDRADRGVELPVVTDVRAFDPTGDVVVQDCTRRAGGKRAAEVLLEAVIRELQAFLRAVGPQVAVHAAVHKFTEFIGTRAPRVVPQSTPVRRSLEAREVRDLHALGTGGFECPEGGEAAGAGADDRNTVHGGFALRSGFIRRKTSAVRSSL